MVGQKPITDALSASIKTGKISHAYLFIGPRGCGKTSVARILAHEINGFKYEIEDDYVDIIEIDGASNRGIDDIRELREKVLIAPSGGKYKVYIIDEVHMLTKEAFNALLKTLEEPPAHAVFIMATTDAYKVPVTITSRAQVFTFKLSDHDTMFKYLSDIAKKEKVNIEDDALDIIVKRGGGSFRDSLSLLDQISTLSEKKITKEMVVSALGLPQDEKIAELLNEYLDKDVVKITTIIKELLSSGTKPETLAEELILTIVENPKPELLSLLGKLPEVKPPYTEAKLLVALTQNITPRHTNFEQPVIGTTISEKKPVKEPPKKESSNDIKNKTTNEFNWDNYLEKVHSESEAVYSQLVKTHHDFDGKTLHIYPAKGIVRSILSRDKNKEVLVKVAGNVEITIHSEKDTPNGAKKDTALTKLSDIMGGEVENDGGGSPF